VGRASFAWLGFGLWLTACAPGAPATRSPGPPSAPPPAPDPEAALCSELDAFDLRLAPRARALNLAAWDALTGQAIAPAPRLAELELEVRRLFADPALYGRWSEALTSGRAASPVLRRRLSLHLAELREHQAPWQTIQALVGRAAEAEARLQRLRYTLDGEPVPENELYAVLQSDRDELRRREAWEGLLARGPVLAEELRALARLRNEAARAAGFPDHRRMRLVLSEQPSEALEALFSELERRTASAFAEERAGMRAELAQRHGLPEARLQPWHLEDPFFAHAPRAGRAGLEPWLARLDPRRLLTSTLEGLGAPAEPGLARADLEERPGKRFGALCLDLDRAGDVRLLASVRPGEVWTSALLHELGHLLFHRNLDPALPWGLRTPAHPALSEGLAVLFARLVHQPAWLARVAGLGPAELERLGPELGRRARREALVRVRFGLLVAAFEAELYRDPEQDLDARWRELRSRYLMEGGPAGRDAPDWAALTHLLSSPAGYQDYVLAELVASQLGAWLRREGGGADWSSRPDAWRLLVARLVAPGASQPWGTLLTEATGSALGVQAFAEEFGLP